jgi:prepilin-type N-terminal cleavage/methylation domain-containing protein
MMARRGTRGFTLIELLTVIGIIALLLGLVVAVLGPAREKAKRAQVLNLIKNIEGAAKVFQLAYNRWPWDVEGKTLGMKLNAGDIFVELSPANAALTPASYTPLFNRQRAEYLAIAPNWIKDGKVVDAWGNELEFFWNPEARCIVIVSPGRDKTNDTIDAAGDGKIKSTAAQSDDISNL